MPYRLALVAILAQLTAAIDPSAAAAEDDLASRQRLVATLHREVGLERSLDQWKKMILSQDPVQACGCEIPPEAKNLTTEAWRNAVETFFDSRNIAADIAATLAAKHSERELEFVLDFFSGPIGKKVTASENASVVPDEPGTSDAQRSREIERLIAAASRLADNPARSATIDRMIETTDSLRFQVEAMMSISQGSVAGARTLTPKNRPRLSDDEIDLMLDNQRAMMTSMMSDTLPAFFESLYARMSDDELSRYAQWQQNPVASGVRHTSDSALIAALHAAAEKIGADFAKNIEAEKI